MKFEKEYITERAKFFDGLAKMIYPFVLLFCSGIGALLFAKDRLNDMYFKGLLIFNILLLICTTIFWVYIIIRYYHELEKLK